MSASSGNQAAAAARIGVAAELLGFADVQFMTERLLEVTGMFAGATAFTDAEVRTFAIGVALPPDEWLARRMATLAANTSPSKALARAAVARAGQLWVERGLGVDGPTGEGMAGVSAVLAIHGPATLDEDVAVASAIGLAPDVAAALGSRMRELTIDHEDRRIRVVRTTICPESPPADMILELGTAAPPDIVARVQRAATTLAITPAQLRLLDTVHPILAGASPVSLRCGARADRVEPGVTLCYSDVSLDNALRVINGLSAKPEAPARWGTLVGALGATKVSSLDLSFGPHDPVPARLGLVVATE